MTISVSIFNVKYVSMLFHSLPKVSKNFLFLPKLKNQAGLLKQRLD